MAEIKSREQNPVPGIDHSEIHIPDENNLGTGTFITVLEPDAMARISPIISTIVNEPVFKLLVNILLAENEVTVLIGKADKSPPLSRAVFKLPDIPDLKKKFRFDATFSNWKITALQMDGEPLKTVRLE
ncbi:MAG TPA: hypothetical protein ENG95_07220 [Nitrospirae bacterium]|nr:hypothetical protein BMS3Abin10_01208 [bacterium BMS3Abin10]GBE38426.1 hypothetical protein BMS3Bbin08_01032 [bacterium BMS3Bbin08]HDO26416.1 hypothetical protein [Nitrospirota bacterium]